MKSEYANGVLTLTAENDEQKILDYIFSRVDGEPLVLFHMNSLISQRRAQYESDIKDQLFEQLNNGVITLPPPVPVPPVTKVG